MKSEDRVALIRTAFERFNNRDIDGVLELFDPDVEMTDVVAGGMLHGTERLRAIWQAQFEKTDHTIVLRQVMETGPTVFVAAYHQLYDRRGGPVGEGMSVVYRVTFRDDRVSRLEVTPVNEVPEDVRARLR